MVDLKKYRKTFGIFLGIVIGGFILYWVYPSIRRQVSPDPVPAVVVSDTTTIHLLRESNRQLTEQLGVVIEQNNRLTSVLERERLDRKSLEAKYAYDERIRLSRQLPADSLVNHVARQLKAFRPDL